MPQALTLEELLDKTFDEPFLCRPILPRGGRVIIGAPAKNFKSMLTLNAVYDMAEGNPLFGVFPMERPLRVLVIEQELGGYRLQERVSQIHAVAKGSLVYENLTFVSNDHDVNLDTHEGLANLEQLVISECPDLLVLDPLSKFHSRDENSFKEMKGIVNTFRALQEKTGVTILATHHTGKPSSEKNPQTLNAMRGHSILTDDADSIIMLDRPANAKDKDGWIRLTFTLRSGLAPDQIQLRLREGTTRFFLV